MKHIIINNVDNTIILPTDLSPSEELVLVFKTDRYQTSCTMTVSDFADYVSSMSFAFDQVLSEVKPPVVTDLHGCATSTDLMHSGDPNE